MPRAQAVPTVSPSPPSTVTPGSSKACDQTRLASRGRLHRLFRGGAQSAVLQRLTAGLALARDTLHLSELLADALTDLPGVAVVCVSRPSPRHDFPVTVLRTASAEGAERLVAKLDGSVLEALCGCLASVSAGCAGDGTLSVRHIRFSASAALAENAREVLSALGLHSAVRLSWPGEGVPGHVWLFARRSASLRRITEPRFMQRVAQLLAFGWRRLPDPGHFTSAERQSYRLALRSGGMVMHYQPVIELQSGRLVKAEALVRLRDGDRLLEPERFLPLFDDNDLFVLYRQGLRQALSDVQRWTREGTRISLGLNFPPQGLRDPRYLEATAAALAAAPLPDGCQLYLEMLETETLDLADPECLVALFEPWLGLGVRFAQDDLGAGYSSLLRLHRLPFEMVKIDQALVRVQTEDPDRRTIRKVLAFIAALTHLAHVLGLRVCVEGLESPVLAEAAAAIGADLGQGYSIAEPMPAHLLASWLASRKPVAHPQPEMTFPPGKPGQADPHEVLRQFGLSVPAYTRWYEQLAERVERALSAASTADVQCPGAQHSSRTR